MMVGKRQRPPIKRTTSLSEITFDLNTSVEGPPPPSDPQRQTTTDYGRWDQRLSLSATAASSPRVSRRHSNDFLDTGGHFLRSCALCKRRLFPSRDIYMYRGDSAFCSQECRQQQMSQDEREANPATAGPKVAAKGETTAAV